MVRLLFFLSVVIGIQSLFFASAHDSEKVVRLLDATDIGDSNEDFAAFAQVGFFEKLESGTMMLDTSSVLRIESATEELTTEFGNIDSHYDVILQPGHFGRDRGSTGSSGARVSEQKLVAYVAYSIAQQLENEGLNVLVISADSFPRDNRNTENFEGLSSKVFLALHADGSTTPCASGPSIGYEDEEHLFGMHALAYALSRAMNYSYEEFMDDNFTVNLSEYYTFPHIRTAGFKGIIELGELTCVQQESLLIANVDQISLNLAHFLLSSSAIE